jgi:hypothetical protein
MAKHDVRGNGAAHASMKEMGLEYEKRFGEAEARVLAKAFDESEVAVPAVEIDKVRYEAVIERVRAILTEAAESNEKNARL